MSECRCGPIAVRDANADPGAAPERTPQRSILGWPLTVCGWVIPSAILAIMPKCPVCFAGYVALGTGLGLSASAASSLRLGLILACLVSLAYLVGRSLDLRRAVAKFSDAKSRDAK